MIWDLETGTTEAAVALALVLAAVLGLSGTAKWRLVDDAWSAMRLLRLPGWLATRRTASMLAPVEVLLAVLLLVAPPGWAAIGVASAVVVLVVAYWVLVARALRFDVVPTCGCFGRIGQHTITGRTLARNSVLVVTAAGWLAATVLGASGPMMLTFGAGGWAWVAATVLVAAATWFVVAPPHVRAVPAVPATPSDDPEDYVRLPIPSAVLLAPDRTPSTLHEMVAEQPRLLVFVTCSCGSTAQVVDFLAEWRARLAPVVPVDVVSTRPYDVTVDQFPPLEGDLWTDHGGLTYAHLSMSGTPAAVLLGADGLLAGGPVTGVAEVDAFVSEVAEVLAEVG